MDVGRIIRREAYPIRAARILGANGKGVELRSHMEAAVLLRARFDMLLAHEAARQGARLQEGICVEELVRDNGRLVGVKTSQGNIETDAVIVSTGVTGRLSVPPPSQKTLHAIMGWYEGVDDVGDAVELHFDPVVKPYYGWIFPEGKDRVNIGICYAPMPGGLNAQQRFQAFLERLRGRMTHAARIDRLVGHPIASSWRPTAPVQHGTILAGEAAALVDPATAEGIYYALASGRIAGEFLGSLLREGAEPSEARLSRYSSQLRRQVGPRLMAGQGLLKVLETPVLDFALRFGSLSLLRLTRAILSWAFTSA